MPIAIVLCGVPGCGKSTFYREYLQSFSYASSDVHIIAYADLVGKSYTEVFNEAYGDALLKYHDALAQYQQEDKSFVIDRTNATEKSRQGTLAKINPRYKKVAVYFPSYSLPVLKARIDNRVSTGGHFVPDHALQQMLDSYKLPSKNEGFDLVVSSSHLTDILKVLQWQSN